MKQPNSLEDERRALLEHIHSSRAAYRRMLVEEPEHEEQIQLAEHEARLHAMAADPAFPRSMTMRWITDHPYAAAGAVASLLLLPLAIRYSGRLRAATPGAPVATTNPYGAAHAASYAAPAASYPAAGSTPARGFDVTGHPLTYGQAGGYVRPGATPRLMVLGRAAVTGAVTLAGMIARDPSKRQMAMRLFTIASAYLAKRRTDKKQVQEARANGVTVVKT